MKTLVLLGFLFTVFCACGWAAEAPDPEIPEEVKLSDLEQTDVDTRLQEFYKEDLTAEQMTAQMMQKVKKYHIKKKKFVDLNDTDILNNRLKVSETLQQQLTEKEKASRLTQKGGNPQNFRLVTRVSQFSPFFAGPVDRCSNSCLTP